MAEPVSVARGAIWLVLLPCALAALVVCRIFWKQKKRPVNFTRYDAAVHSALTPSTATGERAEVLVDIGMAEEWTAAEAAVMRLLATRHEVSAHIPAEMIIDELHPRPKIEVNHALTNLRARGWVGFAQRGVYLTDDGVAFAIRRKWHLPSTVDADANEKPVTEDEQKMMRMLGSYYEVTPVMPMDRLAGVLGFKKLQADHVATLLRLRSWLVHTRDGVMLTEIGREVVYKRKWDDPKMPDSN
jgi:hypothetical protein